VSSSSYQLPAMPCNLCNSRACLGIGGERVGVALVFHFVEVVVRGRGEAAENYIGMLVTSSVRFEVLSRMRVRLLRHNCSCVKINVLVFVVAFSSSQGQHRLASDVSDHGRTKVGTSHSPP